MADTYTFVPGETADRIPTKLQVGLIDTGNTINGQPIYAVQTNGGGVSPVAAIVGDDGDYATLAEALTANEKYIALKPGSYSGAVTISQSDVTIVGYGVTWTAATASNTFTLTGHRNKLVGLKIEGEHTGASGSMGDTGFGTAIFNDGDYNTFYECTIDSPIGFGLLTDGRTGTVIEKCRFVNVGTDASDPKFVRYCIYMPTCQQSRIINNYVTGWSQAVGLWYSANDNLVADNIFYNNLAYEGATGSEANRSACEDYDVADNGNFRNIWRNNYVDGTTGACFEMASELRGCIVEGNTCRNFGRGFLDGAIGSASGAIAILGGAGEEGIGVTISKNNIYGYSTTNNTAECIDAGWGNRWIDNNFYEYRNSNVGCIYTFDGRGILIRGNNFYNCGRSIYIAATDCVVADNYVEGGLSTYGGSVINIQASGAIVRGNQIRDASAGNAIQIQADNATIDGNHSGNGRVIISAGTGLRITNNYIRATAFNNHVLVASGDFSRSQIRGNTFIQEDFQQAINFAAAASDVRFEQNEVRFTVDNGTHVNVGASMVDLLIHNNTFIRPDSTISISDSGTRTSAEGNHTDAAVRWQIGKLLAGNTVGTSEATIAHGLGYTPTEVRVTMTSAGTVWRSSASDATNIYLTADLAGRTCDVSVR